MMGLMLDMSYVGYVSTVPFVYIIERLCVTAFLYTTFVILLHLHQAADYLWIALDLLPILDPIVYESLLG